MPELQYFLKHVVTCKWNFHLLKDSNEIWKDLTLVKCDIEKHERSYQ